MPELPEVETVVRGLKKSLLDENIETLELSNKSFRVAYPKDFILRVRNAVIKNIRRQAKYIIIELNNASNIIIHLGMSGRVQVGNHIAVKNHDHARFHFYSGKQLVFNDPRRFGLITLLSNNELATHSLFLNLGIEPLTSDLNAQALKTLSAGSRIAIKLFLMDARRIVGIGNIYASEILFRSKINPQKLVNCLNLLEWKRISQYTKVVLNEAIESGGSTLRDYVQSSGDIGYFQHKFQIYGKTNQPCLECGAKINRIVMAGRSTFFCSECQKL
jgi:formamidopyrimidine-DNA glycosylase